MYEINVYFNLMQEVLHKTTIAQKSKKSIPFEDRSVFESNVKMLLMSNMTMVRKSFCFEFYFYYTECFFLFLVYLDGASSQPSSKRCKTTQVAYIDTCPPKTIAILDFKVGDIVWAKLRGSPPWPAKILNIIPSRNSTIEIYWLNDYRTSKVFKTQIFKFHTNFELFSKNAEHRIGLETAIKEALLYLISTSK